MDGKGTGGYIVCVWKNAAAGVWPWRWLMLSIWAPQSNTQFNTRNVCVLEIVWNIWCFIAKRTGRKLGSGRNLCNYVSNTSGRKKRIVAPRLKWKQQRSSPHRPSPRTSWISGERRRKGTTATSPSHLLGTNKTKGCLKRELPFLFFSFSTSYLEIWIHSFFVLFSCANSV